ncbi:DUF4293 domain-containing protein [uncultured Rikenella sp.]|uniref:DUF4293 domain-containing protein n=1 Tax=uncultured Rikenella sp. TaxID=368003 RepID=UPI0025FA4264|nr:DUF4293 domain-containing protein [uncultured Rikenella sp.]
MWQRIQTLYLLVVAGIMGAMLFMDFATVTVGSALPAGVTQTVAEDGTIHRVTVPEGVEQEIVFGLWEIAQNGHRVVSTVYLGVLVALVAGVALVTVFLFRKRGVQVRLCFVQAVLLLGIEGFVVLYIYKLKEGLEAMGGPFAVRYSLADVLPIVALIFVYLAFRGITKDIALVKSLDRIR